jgi:hypothetical protein
LSFIPATLRLLDLLGGVFGQPRRPLDPDRLIADARRRTGLSDFGDDAFEAPLRLFLESCAREADLSVFGHFATRWDIARFLTNLLRLRARERAIPAILDRRISRPIFITGLPRSGTTFLHRLLLEDKRNRGPMVWETIFPLPPARGPDRRVATVERQLRAFARIAPEFAGLHPLRATSPQECSEIAAHAFRSLRFDTNYLIPSYRAWLDTDPDRHLPAYRFHARFLRHLEPQPPENGQFVLKNPEHLFSLPALRAIYPDARVVFVHRDPIRVLASVARLTEVLRAPFTRYVDSARIGWDESARWLDGAMRMIGAADAEPFAGPIHHVRHTDLISDPRAVIAGLYRHFDLAWPDGMDAAIAAYTRARPAGGYRHAAYRLADHGLDEAAERAKFAAYMGRFAITAERV